MNAWQERANEIAVFFNTRLVNRLDAIGAYLPMERRRQRVRKDGKVRTDKVYCLKTPVTLNMLATHCRGIEVGDLRGAYTTDGAGLCRWLGYDIDNHDGELSPAALLAAALTLATKLRKHKLYCVIEDSDGRGGIHLWVMFTGTIPASRLRRFAVKVLDDTGVDAEIFPKQEALSPGDYGNFLRFPGRHHTNDHWSRFWDFDRGFWLDVNASVDAFLSGPLNDPAHVPTITEPKREVRSYVAPASTTGNGERYSEAEIVRQCLPHLGHLADAYDSWVGVGQAMKRAGCDVSEWDAWSAQSPAYIPGGRECREKWQSFDHRTTGKVTTVASLIHHARTRGARIRFYRQPISAAARIGMRYAGVSQ